MWAGKSERSNNQFLTMRLHRNKDVPMFCALYHLLVHIAMMQLRPTHPDEKQSGCVYAMPLFPCKAFHRNRKQANCKSIGKQELIDALKPMFVKATKRQGPFGVHTGKRSRCV
jgi:hypothetical protein